MTLPPSSKRLLALSVAAAFAAVPLAGCIEPFAAGASTSLKEIRFWVEERDWEVAPGVATPAWAFCAEGDGVEPAHGDDPCGVPGPTVRVTKGDHIRLTFENTHSIPHTVHFHGWHAFPVDMNGNDLLHEHMVVQPGESKVFEWDAAPAGTFIYHCHFHTPEHMEMGMSGAFIVEDPAVDKPDREFVAVLDEWAIGDDLGAQGNMPGYNYFTVNGKSFPLTQPWVVDKGDHVRIHLVNGGYEWHAFHIHGYTPMSWEGVAGPKYAVPTDVREVAPGQSVVLDFTADREGVWLSHDHVVPRVTAGGDASHFGAYPRGMLVPLVVGKQYAEHLQHLAPDLVAAAQADPKPGQAAPPADHHGEAAATVVMKDVKYQTETVRVKAGETVRWVNQDAMPHTVTADDGGFDSGVISAKGSWSRTFTEPGTYTYHCAPHSAKDKATGKYAGMVATVVVEAG